MSSANHASEMSLEIDGFPQDNATLAGDRQIAWRKGLAGDDAVVQLQVLQELSEGAKVLGVSELVISLSGSRNDAVRDAAARVLEHVLQPSLSEIPALIESLRDRTDGEISYWAATFLGRLGEKAVDAAPVLCDVVTTSSFLPARERAVWALREIGPNATFSISALRAVTECAPARLRRLCREAISHFDTLAATAEQLSVERQAA